MAAQNQNQNQNQNNTDLFDAYFRRADLDGDGQISGAEAVAFLQGSNLPRPVLAQVWMHADQKKLGYLGRQEFYNALKLVTVAQSKRELTPDIVKAALYTAASAKIPAPQINLAATPAPQSRVAASIPQSSGTAPLPSQNVVARGTPGLGGNVSTNQQFFKSQQNQFMRPPQAVAHSTASPTQQVTAANLMPRGGNMVPSHPPSSNVATNWLGGSISGPSAEVDTQVANPGIASSTNQGGFGLTASGLTSSVQPRPPAVTRQTVSGAPKPQDSLMPSNQLATKDSPTSVISSNGFISNSLFGDDVFSVTPSQQTQSSMAATSSTSSSAVSTALVPASGPQPAAKPSPIESFQGKLTQQPMGSQYQQGPRTSKMQQVVAQSTVASAGTGNLVSSQSTQSQLPWPKMTQSDVQNYTKVFLQVDTDRDGKITGEQARNLFLSWRLPREVLKQVWDLSDQDNDSMLSLREFCTALYLMERHREGRPLPSVLPSSMIVDETLFPTSARPAVPYGGAAWGSAHGFQQPQVMNAPRPPIPSARGRPPRPVSQADANMHPGPQKPKIPVLENHIVNQLSQEEQDSLNSKFKEATEANKKVEELEKEIQNCKAKTEFYRVKMQELVLYKSRCDNRLNEITERVSADKHEVEALARKYEEKYRQTGDVASRLTLEEATFRDIQERKMELYQAIVKFESGDTAEGALQDRANHIQQGLEELVKSVNERCKQYGLRSKPTSLVELPFGWQPGIQEGAADWDEDWDKFEDEGFTFVKELTLDVQNVIAPPKPKSSSVRKETASTNESTNLSSAASDAKSGKVSSSIEQISEKDSENDQSENGLEKSPDSPAENGPVENQSHEFQDSQSAQSSGADGSPHATKTSGANGSPHAMKFDGSPHAEETRSDQGGAESIFSREKSFDEPSWGKYDIHSDADSLWGFDNDNSKNLDQQRHDGNSLFGLGEFNIRPIKIQSSNTDFALPGKNSFNFDESVPSTPAYTDNIFQGKGSSSFADSIPSTPAYIDNLFKGKSTSVFADSVPSTPAYSDNLFKGKGSSIFADSVPSTPAHADNLFKGSSSSIFADSIPSTPAYSFGNSQRGYGEGSDEHSFDSFSRFDSFNMHDSGFSEGPSLVRFDSVRSSRDFDQGHGFPLSFDSFNSHDGHDGGASQSPRYLARFDSMRSTTDFNHSREFPSFDDADPFGSTGPFRTTLESQTPRKDTNHWSAF